MASINSITLNEWQNAAFFQVPAMTAAVQLLPSQGGLIDELGIFNTLSIPGYQAQLENMSMQVQILMAQDISAASTPLKTFGREGITVEIPSIKVARKILARDINTNTRAWGTNVRQTLMDYTNLMNMQMKQYSIDRTVEFLRLQTLLGYHMSHYPYVNLPPNAPTGFPTRPKYPSKLDSLQIKTWAGLWNKVQPTYTYKPLYVPSAGGTPVSGGHDAGAFFTMVVNAIQNSLGGSFMRGKTKWIAICGEEIYTYLALNTKMDFWRLNDSDFNRRFTQGSDSESFDFFDYQKIRFYKYLEQWGMPKRQMILLPTGVPNFAVTVLGSSDMFEGEGIAPGSEVYVNAFFNRDLTGYTLRMQRTALDCLMYPQSTALISLSQDTPVLAI